MVETRQDTPTTKTPHFATLLVMALAPQEVGARIARARKAKGWTHDELKNAMGVDLRTVQRWQKGWDEKKGKSLLPRLGTLMRLADVLGVPQSYFVETEDEQATLEDLSLRVEELAAKQDAILEALQGVQGGRARAQSRAGGRKAPPR
jgi:transcriptional regulator with XRE-family HTH domain